ncbi:arylsulfatase B [Diachasma alloeum]|uniref:arylsulfatase B n=1 Tax=Diachasma alloeum TaxID=454923 RepID=UPI0007382F99|nr:arylsulfatase B [Diachasma alloeum]
MLLGIIVLYLVNSVCGKSPHIIYILADDLGWNDVGFHGAGDIRTPNLDALAYTGLILNRHYVTPLCSPSRSALMTGKYPIHTGMQHGVVKGAEPWGLSLAEKLLPEYLSDLGYRRHIVGKWHLGHYKRKYTPLYRGFESHIGFWTGHHNYFDHTAEELPYWGVDMRRGLDTAWDLHGKYSTDVFSREAVKVIQRHNATEPLFLYLAHGATHSSNSYDLLPVPDEAVEKFPDVAHYKRRKFAAMLSKVDDSVGAVVDALMKKEMLKDSVIVFSSDNGGPAEGFNGNAASNYPLRGVKATPWEGGVRSSALLWTPKLSNPGRIFTKKMHIVDWLPTLLTLAGANKSSIPASLDGIDMWRSMNTNDSPPSRVILHNIDVLAKYGAITVDNWKLINGSDYATYDSWYGPSAWDMPYRINEVIDSLAGRAVTSLGHQLTPDAITKLRENSKIQCGKKDPSLPECRPLEAPCLFDIHRDPCEFNNLVKLHPEMLEGMMRELIHLNSTAVPPRNRKVDPRGNPALWNHTWHNFGDYPGKVGGSDFEGDVIY